METNNILVRDKSAIDQFNSQLDSITDVSKEKDSGFYVDKKDLKSLRQTVSQFKIET